MKQKYYCGNKYLLKKVCASHRVKEHDKKARCASRVCDDEHNSYLFSLQSLWKITNESLFSLFFSQHKLEENIEGAKRH